MRAAQTVFEEELVMKREHNGSWKSGDEERILGPLIDLHTRNTYEESEKAVIILTLATHSTEGLGR